MVVTPIVPEFVQIKVTPIIVTPLGMREALFFFFSQRNVYLIVKIYNSSELAMGLRLSCTYPSVQGLLIGGLQLIGCFCQNWLADEDHFIGLFKLVHRWVAYFCTAYYIWSLRRDYLEGCLMHFQGTPWNIMVNSTCMWIIGWKHQGTVTYI